MNASSSSERRVRSLLHPTDFSAGSELAFAHALKIAVRNHAKLTLLHVSDGSEPRSWTNFPGIRETLERWKLLEPGSERSAVLDELGVEAQKVDMVGDNVLKPVLRFLEDQPVDLLVLATTRREGVPHWLTRRVAEPLARGARVPTLFVPHGVRGAVSPEDGSATLESVLVPVDHTPSPHLAIERAMVSLESYSERGNLTLLYVGPEPDMPALRLPERERWTWQRKTREGEVVEEILAEANETKADLIVMTTAGHQGFFDALRGSTTEQVIRRAPCPILAVPAE